MYQSCVDPALHILEHLLRDGDTLPHASASGADDEHGLHDTLSNVPDDYGEELLDDKSATISDEDEDDEEGTAEGKEEEEEEGDDDDDDDDVDDDDDDEDKEGNEEEAGDDEEKEGKEEESGDDDDSSQATYCDMEPLKKSFRATHLDLSFLKMFFDGLACHEQCSEDGWQWRYVIVKMTLKFTRITEKLRVQFECTRDAEKITIWETTGYHLRRKIEEYKPVVKEICTLLLNCAFIKPSKFDQVFVAYEENTVSLIDLIMKNLGVIDSFFDLPALIKQQFGFIEGRFKLFGMFANHISCLACLYWIGDKNIKLLRYEMESMLSDLVQKYMPYSPEVVSLYIDVFKATGYRKFGAVHRLAVSYVDFIFRHLVIIASKDDDQTLRDRFVMLLSFLMANLEDDSEVMRLLLSKINAIISEAQSLFWVSETKLSTFLHKIDEVELQVGEMYVTLVSSHFNSHPKTNALGFLDSLLVNLNKMLEANLDFTPRVKHNIEIVCGQLALIRPFFQNNLGFIIEDEKLRELWSQIVDMVYFAAYVIRLCPTVSWFGMACLPYIMENINHLKADLEKISDGKMFSDRKLATEMVYSSNALVQRATTSKNEGVFIGYEQDVKDITDHLMRGTKDLRIISVSGMPGQGKTTLVKRIYNDPSVDLYFHKSVWCYVSKECKTGELMVSIARGVGCNANFNSDIQDLIESVWRSLKGKRYLVVLDDIWDVEVWRQVGGSFPNDQCGSRILFTSRNHNLASQADSNAISYPLRQFSDEESWELMKDGLSNCDGFPKKILEVGKQISDLCKGLPLAVSLVSALLRRAGPVFDFWKQVAENLNTYLAGEGCMDIVEMSYKYLPDHLKPCFLYFGASWRGQAIRARRMKLLWIAEGFVKENRMQLAKEYLDDLVSQNLVVATKRSSTGGIKECRIHHDLLYDLCFEKGLQDNFLHLSDQSIVSGTQRYRFQHRLCISEVGPYSLQKSTSTRGELPTSQIHTLLLNSSQSILGSESWCFFLNNFTVLTVLNLEEVFLPMFPEVVLYNIHLRYLALLGDFKDIPSSIVDFWNLEALILRSRYDDVCIPEMLWEMQSLKYVHIQRFSLQPNKLSFMSIAKPWNIEVLKGISLKYDPTVEESLQRFVHLRKLNCYCDEKKDIDPKWFSMFRSLENLESLHLYYPLEWDELPAVNFNAEVYFPKSLKKLRLEGEFRLPWSAMSMIGMLPNLEVLKLDRNACIGDTWHLRDGEFSKLRFLKFFEMDEIERIDDSDCDDAPFPCLEKLILWNCERLEELPSSFADIYTLDTVDVCNCRKVLDSVREIIELQRDVGNDSLRAYMNDVLMKENDDESDYFHDSL